MLSCALCGSRPASEFELLPAEGAFIEGAISEYWWHRLGCGRPTVVLRSLGESQVGAAVVTPAPAAALATPAAAALATPAEAALVTPTVATLAAKTSVAPALTTAATLAMASPASAITSEVPTAATTAAPALAARDESALAAPPSPLSPRQPTSDEAGGETRLPLAEMSVAPAGRPGVDGLPVPVETLALGEQRDQRRPSGSAPPTDPIGSLWSPTRPSRRGAASKTDRVLPAQVAGASDVRDLSDADSTEQPPSPPSAGMAGSRALRQSTAPEPSRQPASTPDDAEFVVLSAGHDQSLVEYHYTPTRPIGGSVDPRRDDPRSRSRELDDRGDVSASEVDEEALDRFRGRARLGGVQPLPRRTGVPTPWPRGVGGPPQQVQVGRRSPTATALSPRDDGDADDADLNDSGEAELTSTDAAPPSDVATTGRRLSGMFSPPRTDSGEDRRL